MELLELTLETNVQLVKLSKAIKAKPEKKMKAPNKIIEIVKKHIESR